MRLQNTHVLGNRLLFSIKFSACKKDPQCLQEWNRSLMTHSKNEIDNKVVKREEQKELTRLFFSHQNPYKKILTKSFFFFPTYLYLGFKY